MLNQAVQKASHAIVARGGALDWRDRIAWVSREAQEEAASLTDRGARVKGGG